MIMRFFQSLHKKNSISSLYPFIRSFVWIYFFARPSLAFLSRGRSTLKDFRVKMSIDDEIAAWVERNGHGTVESSKSLGSSDWASFRQVIVSKPPSPATSFFVKTSSRSAKEMFEGEALGLQAMYECSGDGDCALRIPKVFNWGDASSGRGSFLIMEYLKFGGSSGQKSLGQAMAQLHLSAPSSKAGNPGGKFGFPVDNTIGGTPQPNPWTDGGSTEDWVGFFRDHRIGHQLDLAGDQSMIQQWKKDIAPRLGALFDGVEIRPSILHGDLWSGNIGSADGKPSIFDPASYWGHHEAEWGMSWCANFGSDFWEGYRSLIPKDQGFDDRKPLYDAYHQLNHYNLFGGFYKSQAARQLDQVKQILDDKGA